MSKKAGKLLLVKQSRHPLAMAVKRIIYQVRIIKGRLIIQWNDYKRRKAWENLFKNEEKMVLDKPGYRINLYKESELANYIYLGFEEKEILFLQKFLRSGDGVLDIGANIGLFTLEAAAIVGEKGRVTAYEPDPATYTRLVENCMLNDFSFAHCKQMAVSSQRGVLQFNIAGKGYDAWNSLAPIPSKKITNTIDVNTTTLDHEISEYPAPENITLIKIDVEGWELFVLKGGADFLQQYSPVCMVEFTEINLNAAGSSSKDVFECMEGFGYTWYSFNGTKLLLEIRKPNYPYENLLAIKDYSFVLDRIEK
jgi:FkbM family methyltransferase